MSNDTKSTDAPHFSWGIALAVTAGLTAIIGTEVVLSGKLDKYFPQSRRNYDPLTNIWSYKHKEQDLHRDFKKYGFFLSFIYALLPFFVLWSFGYTYAMELPREELLKIQDEMVYFMFVIMYVVSWMLTYAWLPFYQNWSLRKAWRQFTGLARLNPDRVRPESDLDAQYLGFGNLADWQAFASGVADPRYDALRQEAVEMSKDASNDLKDTVKFCGCVNREGYMRQLDFQAAMRPSFANTINATVDEAIVREDEAERRGLTLPEQNFRTMYPERIEIARSNVQLREKIARELDLW